jgi:hypothetical protein
MKEVDRLSISGTYPALPILGQRKSRRDEQQVPARSKDDDKPSESVETPAPKPPKTLIDEYV